MPNPYKVISRRDLLNTLEAALHSGYLCLKIPTTFGVISVFGSQQDAKNIEKGFVLGHKSVHFLWEESEQHNTSTSHHKAQALAKYKKAIEAEGEVKKVPLDVRVPDRTVCIGTEASQQEQAELLAFLDKNNNVFAWSTSDSVRISRDVIEHRLQVNPMQSLRCRSFARCLKRKWEQRRPRFKDG
jgi:hypothetical protein